MPEIALAFYIFSSIAYSVYFYDQKPVHHRSGFLLLLAAFLMHLGAIIANVIHIGYLPVYSLRDVLSFASVSLTAVFLVIRILLNIRIMGMLASFLSALVLGFSMFASGYEFSSAGAKYNAPSILTGIPASMLRSIIRFSITVPIDIPATTKRRSSLTRLKSSKPCSDISSSPCDISRLIPI